MDFIFVADLSGSMAQLGNENDQNARFYDMQSKLADVTGVLLNAGEGYDCRVAIVTFGAQTSEQLPFTNNSDTVLDYIKDMEPVNELTAYGMGLKPALKLAQENTSRNTAVIFLSDGLPFTTDGSSPASGDLYGTSAAADIKKLGVPIYGVFHSPGGYLDIPLGAMEDVCNKVFVSQDTESFSTAMNSAFAAAYGTDDGSYTVTIPVNPAFENVRELKFDVTAGEATYNSGNHTITWTITGMPFIKHTLTYKMSLTKANADRYGDQVYPANDPNHPKQGNAWFDNAGGASVETPVLKRSVRAPGNPFTPPTFPIYPNNPGTTIRDDNVPLAAPGLNSVDHFDYIKGYPDGTVRPAANITRGEVATIFFRLMTNEFRTENWSTENSFSDVKSSDWYNNAISTCVKAGILKGYTDGTFRPNQAITRAEFAAIAASFASEAVPTGGMFKDIEGHWAQESIERAAAMGWIKGSNGLFRPNDRITRAEVVTTINRMLDRIPDADHLLPDMKTFPDNTRDMWWYADMQEATNSHDYEFNGDQGTFEVWTEMLPEQDWLALEKEWSTAADTNVVDVAANLTGETWTEGSEAREEE